MAILHRDLRASDRDREDVVALLKASYLEGRLPDHELARRSDAAYRAEGIAELRRLISDLPARAGRSRRRRRRGALVPIALLVLVFVSWFVIVPPEVTIALVMLFTVLGVLAVFLLAPVWIPVLLAFIAYRLIRTRLSSG